MGCYSVDSFDQKNQIDSCPKCGEVGSRVKLITIKSHLLDQYIGKINESVLYKFCKNPNCDVVYFSPKGKFFLKNMLREKVTVKDNGTDVKICYCFNVTKGDIEIEIMKTGQCNATEVIREKMKNLGCFCEISNPQGSCCLANITSFINQEKIRGEK